jgi:NurA-like 5'-3' nuclease
MESDSIDGQMEENIKENGLIKNCMVLVSISGKMVKFTQGSMRMIKSMVMEFILSKMQEHMKVGGVMVSNMVLDHFYLRKLNLD